MNINEALNILDLSGDSFTQDEIKTAYRKMAKKYHPDLAAEENKVIYDDLMKAINAAYEFLKSLDKTIELDSDTATFYNYSEEMESVLRTLYSMEGLIIEICGNWIWISGDTKTHKEQLGKNGLGCLWAKKKQQWFYRPEEHKSRNRGSEYDMNKIREVYGSSRYQPKTVYLQSA